MKQIASIGIIFLLIGLSILPSVSSTNIIITQVLGPSKTVIQVDDDGDGDFISIQDAIDNASDGDTIEVHSGEYNELVRIDKQLSLVGVDHELGNGNGVGKPLIKDDEFKMDIVKVTANNCNISGIHITSTEFGSTGIHLEPSNNTNIYNNDFEELNTGIHLRYSSHNNFYDNYFYGTYKMYMSISVGSSSSYNKIYDNIIAGNGHGIELRNRGEYNAVYNNTIYDLDGGGIGLCYVYNTTVNGNIITDCGGGIGVTTETNIEGGTIIFDNIISGGGGIAVFGKNHKVYYNNISNSERHGIMVHGNHNKIYQNNIGYCKYGIHLEKYETMPPVQCYLNDVYENNIINCSNTGFWLDGAYFNEIYKNNIIGNEIYGLNLIKSEENNIYENNISYNNKYGIHLWDSEWNRIYHNNVIGNPTNAWCDGAPNDRRNIWNTDHHGGNYWSDYDGEDKNNDGVGDKPYVIPDMDNNPFNNNKDKYPLMEPDGRPIPRPRTLNNLILGLMSILQRLLGFIR